jgi:hypothetical protein
MYDIIKPLRVASHKMFCEYTGRGIIIETRDRVRIPSHYVRNIFLIGIFGVCGV